MKGCCQAVSPYAGEGWDGGGALYVYQKDGVWLLRSPIQQRMDLKSRTSSLMLCPSWITWKTAPQSWLDAQSAGPEDPELTALYADCRAQGQETCWQAPCRWLSQIRPSPWRPRRSGAASLVARRCVDGAAVPCEHAQEAALISVGIVYAVEKVANPRRSKEWKGGSWPQQRRDPSPVRAYGPEK